MQPAERAARVLIAEDDSRLARLFQRALSRRGYVVEIVSDGTLAIDEMKRGGFDAMVLDLNLPGADGWTVLEARRTMIERPQVLVVTGSGERDLALRAMRAGANDFLEKPVDAEEVVHRLDQLIATSASTMRRQLKPPEASSQRRLIAHSPAMLEALALAERLARSPAGSALIIGESGAGKEVVAGHVHACSSRAKMPFVRVNLAALATSMIEAELFGSVKGAFTGSTGDRTGLFASAHGGTILLDEFIEFDVALQPKLLRVLEGKRYYPVGSDKEREVDARVLCATNVDPREAIASGRLRSDLFYRISTIVIRVPPLRDRREDILPLAHDFLARSAAEAERVGLFLTKESEEALLDHSWPGNVRELRNVMERAVIVAAGEQVNARDLGLSEDDRLGATPSSTSSALSPSKGVPSRPAASAGERRAKKAEPSARPAGARLDKVRDEVVAQAEKEQIEAVLRSVGGSPTRAAEALGIARSTLWLKMRRYGIARDAAGAESAGDEPAPGEPERSGDS